MANINKVRKAIEIQGYIEISGSRGRTYKIEGITKREANGAWLTTHLNSSLDGYIRIAPHAHKMLAARADRIIGRADEIRANKAAALRRALDLD